MEEDRGSKIAATMIVLVLFIGGCFVAWLIGHDMGKAEVEAKVCESQGGTYNNEVGCFDPVELDL